MITRMKKLTFLVFYKEYKEFLDRMGELGVLHVIEKQQGALDDAEVQEQMRLLSRYATAIEALQKVEAKSESSENSEFSEPSELLEKYDQLLADKAIILCCSSHWLTVSSSTWVNTYLPRKASGAHSFEKTDP